MAYATYEYYRDSYGGTAIPEAMFDRCARFASRRIDYFTFGRIRDPAAVEGLADCVCEMADAAYQLKFGGGTDGSTAGRAKKSETIDGYSVSYVAEQREGEDMEAFLSRKLFGICRTYLLHTGLMDRRVRRKC